MQATFATFSQELSRLVETFGKNLIHYKGDQYDEASLRQEFLNPFFRALGWDTENTAGAIPSHREVEIESRTTIGGQKKRADYLFRTDKIDRFICEAKKPAEELRRYAFQTKRYTWNKGVFLGVLSDFEELRIFVVGSKPRAAKSEKDKAVLQNAVEATDRQIDALVYELYGLTPEEIALVEGERK